MRKIQIKTVNGNRLYLVSYIGKDRFITSLGHNLSVGLIIENNIVKYNGKNHDLIKDRELINERIIEVTGIFREGVRELERANRLTLGNLKEYFKKNLDYKQENKSVSDIADEYKSGLYSRTIFSDRGTPYSYQSIRSISASVHKFSTFCEENNLTLFDLDERTGAKYIQWAGREIETQKKDEDSEIQQASLSTLAKDIKNAKTFCRWLIDKCYLTSKDLFFRDWKKPRDIDETKIYLSDEELEKLDLTFINASIDKYRFLFQIMARTGLRVSDLVNLQSASLKVGKNGAYLDIMQEKTETRVIIPVNETTRGYLDTMFSDPYYTTFTPQKLNKHIKTIAKEAGINTPVIVYKKTLKGIKETTLPKYELVTCHVARHSFACNMYLKNMPLSIISRLLGHANEKITLRYIKAALPDIVNADSNIWEYFNSKSKKSNRKKKSKN